MEFAMISLGGLAHKFAFSSPIFKPLLLEEREKRKELELLWPRPNIKSSCALKGQKLIFVYERACPRYFVGLGEIITAPGRHIVCMCTKSFSGDLTN